MHSLIHRLYLCTRRTVITAAPKASRCGASAIATLHRLSLLNGPQLRLVGCGFEVGPMQSDGSKHLKAHIRFRPHCAVPQGISGVFNANIAQTHNKSTDRKMAASRWLLAARRAVPVAIGIQGVPPTRAHARTHIRMFQYSCTSPVCAVGSFLSRITRVECVWVWVRGNDAQLLYTIYLSSLPHTHTPLRAPLSVITFSEV